LRAQLRGTSFKSPHRRSAAPEAVFNAQL